MADTDGYLIECLIAVFLSLFFAIVFLVQLYQHKKERQKKPNQDIFERIIFWQRVVLVCVTASSFVFAFYAYEPLLLSNLTMMLFFLFVHTYIVSIVFYLIVPMYVFTNNTQIEKGDWRTKAELVPLTVRILLGMDVGLICLICVVQFVIQVWFPDSKFTFVFFPLSISLFSLFLVVACIYFYLQFRSTLLQIHQPNYHNDKTAPVAFPLHYRVRAPSPRVVLKHKTNSNQKTFVDSNFLMTVSSPSSFPTPSVSDENKRTKHVQDEQHPCSSASVNTVVDVLHTSHPVTSVPTTVPLSSSSSSSSSLLQQTSPALSLSPSTVVVVDVVDVVSSGNDLRDQLPAGLCNATLSNSAMALGRYRFIFFVYECNLCFCFRNHRCTDTTTTRRNCKTNF